MIHRHHKNHNSQHEFEEALLLTRMGAGVHVTITPNMADEMEAGDDFAFVPSSKNPYRAGLHEISGLVRRARTELADGNPTHAARTLGRISDAIDSELNK